MRDEDLPVAIGPGAYTYRRNLNFFSDQLCQPVRHALEYKREAAGILKRGCGIYNPLCRLRIFSLHLKPAQFCCCLRREAEVA